MCACSCCLRWLTRVRGRYRLLQNGPIAECVRRHHMGPVFLWRVILLPARHHRHLLQRRNAVSREKPPRTDKHHPVHSTYLLWKNRPRTRGLQDTRLARSHQREPRQARAVALRQRPPQVAARQPARQVRGRQQARARHQVRGEFVRYLEAFLLGLR